MTEDKSTVVVEDLLKPRIKMIAPIPKVFSCGIEVGQIWFMEDGFYNLTGAHRIGVVEIKKYPHLFKELEWWQERTIEVMQSVKFVKVIKYVGYWLVGDIVPVEKFICEHGKPYGYNLTQHFHPVFCLLPSTESEYNQYISSQSKTKA